jgi:hypothetical protein
VKLVDATEPTRCSITSSALTSLLPIASASGIVQTNYNTPKISFYSPSGRLIQPECSSSPEANTSIRGASPTVTTSYYNKTIASSKRHTLASIPYLPPARPSLVPMTTPPTTTAQLPAHLRHHHNYRHPEKSQIVPCESLVESTPAVKGCDGIVRIDSLSPISGVLHSPHTKMKPNSNKRHRSSRSFIRDVKSDANFYKSRLIHFAVQSCGTTSVEMGRKRDRSMLRKQYTTHSDPMHPPAHGGKPLNRSTGKGSQPIQTTSKLRMNRKGDKEILGPVTGHTLRICFCQPYDGVGKQTRIAATSDFCSNTSDPKAPIAGRGPVNYEIEPATRIVRSAAQKRKATRKGKISSATAAFSGGKKGRSATDPGGAHRIVTMIG